MLMKPKSLRFGIGLQLRHCPRLENKVADALRRKTTLLVSISNEVVGFDSVKELYPSDEDFGNIWMELETKQHRGEFILLDGYLFKGNRLCIPKTSFRSQLIKEIFVTDDCDDRSRPEEQHLVVQCFNEEIVKFSTQPATTEISGEDVEDEPLTVLGSGRNIIKEDFSNDLDGQHLAYENLYECLVETRNDLCTKKNMGSRYHVAQDIQGTP
ncbi:hypothetical protein Tco_1169907 [Tanacetum coccineum]